MPTIVLKVTGMTCGGCVKSIQNALEDQAGIDSATADLDAAAVTVAFNDAVIQEPGIKEAILAAGFEVAD